MYFKKLELIGFKSFCNKTTLHFEPGITAIVGPNGCGKCLTAESLVSLADGTRIKIKELVDLAAKHAITTETLDDGFVYHTDLGIHALSLNLQTLKIETKPIYAFVKRKAPDFLLKIKTRSGREITTTHYHPFFGLDDGKLVILKAEQLNMGVRIAVTRDNSITTNNGDLFSNKISNYSKNNSPTCPIYSNSKNNNTVLQTKTITNTKYNYDLDLIPGINNLIKDLVKLSKLNLKRIKKISPKLVSYYENRCLPSRQGLNEALSIIAEHSQLQGPAKALFDYLKIIANSDIYWDEIAEVEKISPPEWVYDLSIKDNHNFIADDIIAHNSNIFDSIRWVLGEQSVKSLRGSNMEDVIFNGTDTKEPVGMAEVSLTFDNSNKFFPIDSDEIIISRRIFRSGESEYLLNKTQVRLKDILDILLGTGIGAESYSIVPQGKIDLILSSRPEDRRLIFDEASGITKYKAQKREALRRLEETEQNLLRVNDIITEVKRQIGSLERQASKARKYKDAFEELKNKELVLGILQKNEINKLKIQISESVNALTQEETRLSQIIKGQEESISGSQSELKTLEEQILTSRTQLITLENLITRSKERIELNKERMNELDANKASLAVQAEQSKTRLLTDGEKLNLLRLEYANLKSSIESKTAVFKEKELLLNNISQAIKLSLENIASGKKSILDILTKITHAKNELTDSNSKQQIQLARKKRLEIERAKINEEKTSAENLLSSTKQELDRINAGYEAINSKALTLKNTLEEEKNSLKSLGQIIEGLEKQKLSLESQKQFIQELKTKYDDISEAMNAIIYLDKLPNEKISGLVVRITDTSNQENNENNFRLRASGEAKPFDLDTQKITEKILGLEEKINTLKNNQTDKQTAISSQENELNTLHDQLRGQEIILANKKASYQVALDQFNRLIEEFNLAELELAEVATELASLGRKNTALQSQLDGLDNEQKAKEGLITSEQNNIAANNSQKEGALVIITQIKTELEALSKRINSDDVNLRALEERYNQDKENVLNIETQINDCAVKHKILESENEELGNKIVQTNLDIVDQSTSLKETEAKFKGISSGISEIIKRIDVDKQSLESVKNRAYQLQMQDKDAQYKYLALSERLAQAYKIDLEQLNDTSLLEIDPRQINTETLREEINKIKEKVNSYGSVNLVAIEEYDELKKRYDFLNQQQTDLVTAKDSLREAISKINRTTKQMFLETFEKVRLEFRNYFKLLFNGGDAQVYLIDEQDPLESGIEIICRPPGKKLQNVLLLSGGEKSMSAIALIFAIFKIKPAPFCVLDEIDAALDEANVDRFGRVLQDFSKISQFIVITHNKKTIANANIMYGITMEESGVSKIVSVKFAQDKPAKKETNPDIVGAPLVGAQDSDLKNQ